MPNHLDEQELPIFENWQIASGAASTRRTAAGGVEGDVHTGSVCSLRDRRAGYFCSISSALARARQIWSIDDPMPSIAEFVLTLHGWAPELPGNNSKLQ
ncbi:MAG TPA: hypothetical protein VKT49_21315 [Bryobacteraceae bacterium]|nr:hypothetical protein [Bryobacteraceae bacterium]